MLELEAQQRVDDVVDLVVVQPGMAGQDHALVVEAPCVVLVEGGELAQMAVRAHGAEHRADLNAARAEVCVGDGKARAPHHAHGEHPARVFGRGCDRLGPDAFMPLQRPSVALEHPCLLLQYLR